MKTTKSHTEKKLLELSKAQLWKTLLCQFLLPSLIGCFFLTSPAEARRLESWRFQQDGNQLSFSTASRVQPRAQLISDPTRLVIDLPGISIGQIPRRLRSQYVGGKIREIRVGQFERNIARIVVELAEGYTLDPSQIKFEGVSPTNWNVTLPEPQPLISASTPLENSSESPDRPSEFPDRPTESPDRPSESPDRPSDIPSSVSSNAQTVLQDIQVNQQGIVFRTTGRPPEIEVNKAPDGSWMTIDLPDSSLLAGLEGLDREVKRLGVETFQVIEFPNNSLVRVTLGFSNNRQRWNASVSDSGGVLLWPDGGVAPGIAEAPRFATIESVELANNGTELIIKSDRPLTYDDNVDPQTSDYGITIFSAEMGEGVRLPNGFEANSPILSIQQREDQPETVTLVVQPNPNFRVAGVLPQGQNQISLQLRRKPRIANNPPPIVVPPRPTTPVPPENPPQIEVPRTPNNRMVIIIDPGHGGRDPGAIGLGGLRETDVVLDISHQVTQILEQNGIQAIMTRTDERTIDLAPRTQLANRVNADLFVSIHANAVGGGRTEVNGLETFYYQSGSLLAQYIQNSMLQSFNMNNRGVKRARFYVLRHSRMPAVLVETGFLTGSYDSQILADPTQRTRMAEAIARGILQYVQRIR